MTRYWGVVLVLCCRAASSAEPKPDAGAALTDSSASVVDDVVYLRPGAKVAVEAEVLRGELVHLKLVKKVSHPERTLLIEFSRDESSSRPLLLLQLKNPFKQTLKYQAGIEIGEGRGFESTSTIPVSAGLESFEAWGDPLSRIALTHFVLST